MTMDDVREEKNHIFNIRLAKCTGLYQMLDPGTTKFLGRNVYHIALAFILMYLCAISIMSTVSCLYYWTDNMLISLEDFVKVETALFVIYKMWIVIHHSNDIWNCLSITRYGFTSFGFRERHILDRWRKRSMKCSNLFAITYLICVAIFVGTTQAFRNKTTPVKNRDGSVGYYRQNIMNFYIIVSDETYNSHYNKFCFAEALFTVSIGMLFLIFDTLLATLCFAICGQMQIINATFESVGHKSIRDSHSPVDYIVDGKIKMSKVHDLIYDELKTILMEHQEVMKKYEMFLALFEKVMLMQILFSSLSLIILWVILLMIFFDDSRFVNSEVTTLQMVCLIPSYSFQIFMVCYLFGNLHNQKDSIIFALYSSNWTEMNINCKKMILFIIKMNNANYKKLKFTSTKIINLEMFFKTMGNCYTVISVLINQIKTKNE